MTSQEWATEYRRHMDRADRVSEMIRERARQACAKAGLDPNLLGIHPHNAMVSYENGHPWPEVNYDDVRLSLHLQNKQWNPYRLVEQWSRKAWEKVQR